MLLAIIVLFSDTGLGWGIFFTVLTDFPPFYIPFPTWLLSIQILCSFSLGFFDGQRGIPSFFFAIRKAIWIIPLFLGIVKPNMLSGAPKHGSTY